MMKRISDFLAWLGGAYTGVLAKVPQERGRFVQMACVLLTTASIAAVSMIFAMHDGVKVLLAGAIFFGLFWGLIILNLDRFLVLSMGSTRDLRRLIWIAVPRLLLAAVVSLVIATPLTLRIFQSDINVALNSANLNESKLQQQQVKNSGLQQQADALFQQIKTDKATLHGQPPASVTSPQLQTAQQQISTLTPEVNSAKQQEINAYEAWQCELYGDGPGCAGASNRAGKGPIAQAKQQTYLQDLSTYNSLNGQLQTAEKNEKEAEANLKQAQGSALANDQAAARKELPGLERQYASLDQKIKAIEKNNQDAINANTGILAQLSALSSASSHNFTLFLAQLTVTLLFFFIELLPVAVKFLLNLGPLSAYEEVAKREDEKVLDKVRLERLTDRRNAERKSDEERKKADAESRVRINIAEDMSRREEAMGIHANEHVAGKMEEILDAALQEWNAQVRERLNGSPAGAPNGSGNRQFAGGGPASADDPYSNEDPAGSGSSPPHQTRQSDHGFGLPPDRGML